jgi:autotransporter-associated beta strand protein
VINGNIDEGPGGAEASHLIYQGTGTLTLSGTNTYAGTTTVSSGTMAVVDSAIPVGNNVVVTGGTYRADASADVLELGTLSVEGGTAVVTADGDSTLTATEVTVAAAARLDMTDNDMVVNYATGGPSPEFALRDKVLLARDGDAEGIFFTGSDDDFSDTILAFGEAAELGFTEFNGVTVDGDSVLGKYTYYGDANFDGAVTTDDYVAVDLGLGTGDSWVQGDFDLNGVVTTDDYVVVDLNLGKGSGDPLAYAEEQAAMIALHTEMFGQSYVEKLAYASEHGWVAASVPEPGTFGVIGLAAAGLLRRRRKSETTIC